MGDRKRRVVPELRDIPFAWATCDQRIAPDPDVEREGKKFFEGYSVPYSPVSKDFADCNMARKQTLCCEALVRYGRCPRGFA